MLLTAIKRWLFGDNYASLFAEASHPAERLIPPELRPYLENHNWRNLRYPPYQEGYPGKVTGEWFMRHYQRKLIDRIAGSIGLPKDEYQRYVEPILINFAELAHLLPASENHHHAGPGGLLRHSLEVANLTLDGCLTTAFDTAETPARRSTRRWRWNVAGVAAALLHDAGKALTDLRATDFEGKLEWNPGRETLHQWAMHHKLDRYFLHWNAQRHEKHIQVSVALAHKLIPDETVAWLMEGGRDIYGALFDAIAGNANPAPLTELVRWADSASVRRDLLKGPSHAGGGDTGVPVIRLVSDAMLRLLSTGRWMVNVPGSRVWVATDGVYIAWHSAAEEIVSLLVKDGIVAIPRSPETLLAILADHGLAQRRDDGDLYWLVTPQALCRNGKGPALRCLKLSSPDVLFPHVPVPPPTSILLGKEGEQIELIAPNEKSPFDRQRPVSAPTAVPAQEPAAAKPQPPRQPEPAPEAEQSDISVPRMPTEPSTPSMPAPAAAEMPSSAEDAPPASIAEPSDEPPMEEAMDDPDAELERMLLGTISPEQRALATSNLESAPEPEVPEFPRKNASGKVSLAELLSTPTDEQAPSEPSASGKVSLAEVLGTPADAPSAPEPSPEPEATRGKVSLAALLAEPEPAHSDSQPQPSMPLSASGAEATAPGQKVLLTPEQEARLTPAEIALLEAQPAFARKLLACLGISQELRLVSGRVFVPLGDSPYNDDDILPLFRADWLWQDFTTEEAPLTRAWHKRTGFLLTARLSVILCKLAGLDWGIPHSSRIPAEKIPSYRNYLAAVLEQARPEKVGGVDTLVVNPTQLGTLAQQLNTSVMEIEEAIFYLRDAMKVHTRKKLYIRALPQEVPTHE
ncbi:conjugal transfer pilus assembly protein TraI [Azotobacter beijerinckii]|uniref:Conjugal transfer pilus assembly protein TraI n=2 Tax=Azotobacter beijerinckii TaxID=170623 RepID=A0A1H6WIM8_9GAMM|nr:MobH family relaxase [Azotobacter beijerinckii]SEJ16899.1 conjugal transfer pilus assembly protein TraI [Azotobacter beijerinckii]